MAADAELTRLIAEKARIQASIDQIEADNTVQGSFGDVNVRRNEIKELEDQRNRINLRIQRRKGQLLKLRDPVWGSVIRATRQPPDGLDTQLGDYTIGETDLDPAGMGGGDTPETPLVPSHPVHTGTHRRYLGWSDDVSIAATDFTAAAVFTSDVLTVPARTANGYLWFATDEDVGFPDSLIVSTNPVINQITFYLEGVVPVMFAGVDYVLGVNPNLLNPARLVGATITLGYAAS